MFGKESIGLCSYGHFIDLFYHCSWNWALLDVYFCTVMRDNTFF